MANSMFQLESLKENSIIPMHTKRPTCIIVVGMAGSGKTTFVRNIVSKFYETGLPYVINLDPACEEVPYPPNIDIRDIINYKDVIARYGLSFDDGITTTLNLFSTQFDEIIETIENDGEEHEYIVVDIPGQPNIFSWFAGGNIITRALSSRFPTIAVYMMDAVINIDRVAFMSDILNAGSIMQSIKLPFVVVINKIDLIDHSYAIEWLQEFAVFQETLVEEDYYYCDNPRNGMVLPSHEFFGNMYCCGVSARTGEGMPLFLEILRNAVERYNLILDRNIHKFNRDAQSHTAEKRIGHDKETPKSNKPSEDREP